MTFWRAFCNINDKYLLLEIRVFSWTKIIRKMVPECTYLALTQTYSILLIHLLGEREKRLPWGEKKERVVVNKMPYGEFMNPRKYSTLLSTLYTHTPSWILYPLLVQTHEKGSTLLEKNPRKAIKLLRKKTTVEKLRSLKSAHKANVTDLFNGCHKGISPALWCFPKQAYPVFSSLKK